MHINEFRRFYLNASKAGKGSDIDCFHEAYFSLFGAFDRAPAAKEISTVCTKLKTKMMSKGCDNTTATRVIKYFKKWYNDTCT